MTQNSVPARAAAQTPATRRANANRSANAQTKAMLSLPLTMLSVAEQRLLRASRTVEQRALAALAITVTEHLLEMPGIYAVQYQDNRFARDGFIPLCDHIILDIICDEHDAEPCIVVSNRDGHYWLDDAQVQGFTWDDLEREALRAWEQVEL